ncbi:hypothetical protein KR054_004841, partial [Drosophila jambulina]
SKMLRLLILLGLGVLLGILIQGTRSDCNVCSGESNVACVSNTAFQFCSTQQLPTGSVYNCPTGYYCTANAAICDANEAFKSCVGCGTCNADNTFACTSATTFALCLGTTTPSQIVGNCGTNYVCDWNNANICGTTAMGYQATCPGSNDGVPGVDPTTMTPSEYCAIVQQSGRFPYGIDLTTTCRHTFALCLGTTTPSTSIGGTCGSSYVCNLENANICGSPTTYSVTCLGSDTTTCGDTTITNATEYCQSVKAEGRFPYGRNATSTCKQYVNCYAYAGIFYGNIYSCPESTYFDSTSQLCTSATQARCSETVSCLSLNDRRLL